MASINVASAIYGHGFYVQKLSKELAQEKQKIGLLKYEILEASGGASHSLMNMMP